MTLQDFQQQALRTYNDLGDIIKNSLHMTSGMTSEFMKELLAAIIAEDKINQMEEFGDIQWFLVVYCHIHSIPLPAKISPSNSDYFHSNEVSFLIGTLADFDKATLVYNKVISFEERTATVYKLINAMDAWATELGFKPEVARERVIAKLRQRFPGKFSKEDALNRDLEAERTALEGGAA